MARRIKKGKVMDVETVGVSVEDFTKQLPIQVRRRAMKAAVRKAVQVVRRRAKQLVPVGGPREGEKAGKPHLRDTIHYFVRDYGGVKVGVVGPMYPSGAHGHLVEFGYTHIDTGELVGPTPYMRPAADETQGQQAQSIEQELKRQIEKIVEGLA